MLRKVLGAGILVTVAWPVSPALAQYTWNHASNGDWNNPFNWAPLGIGTPNSPTAAVTFGNAGVGAVNISASVQAQSLTFSNTTGAYALTSTAGQILSGVTAINVGSSFTGLQQTINLANVSSGSLLFTGTGPAALTITNDSQNQYNPLLIGPSTVIGTPGSGGITVTGSGSNAISGSFATNAASNQVVGGLTKTGAGSLVFSGNGTNLFGGTMLGGGFLAWDYRTNTQPKLGGGDLRLMNGTLELYGNAAAAVTQSVPSGNTVVTSSDSSLVMSTSSGMPLTLNLGALTRASTGTFGISRDPSSTITTTTGLTRGILGGWATMNSMSWATKNGSVIVGLASYGTDVYAPGVNTDVTIASGIPADFTTNTLRFNVPVTAVLSGTNTIQSGGILVSNGQSVITGGILTSGTGELIVHTFGGLTINSSLNLTGGLTKTGSSILTLAGQTSWLPGVPLTINDGFVAFTNPLAFDTLTNIQFNGRTDSSQVLQFSLSDGQNATCGAAMHLKGSVSNTPYYYNQFQNSAVNSRVTLNGIIGNSAAEISGLSFSGVSESSGFNLTGANTFAGAIFVNGGVLGIASDGNLGNAANILFLTYTGATPGGLEFLNDGTSLAHALYLYGAGRIVVSGNNSNSINSVIAGVSVNGGAGSLTKVGAGTLILNNAGNTYPGGTIVSEGRLTLGVGNAIPAGTNVTVSTGAEFNTGGLSNTPATAIGNLALNGGTFVVSGDGNYHLNKLTTGPTGGTVDLSLPSDFALHFTGAARASPLTATAPGSARPARASRMTPPLRWTSKR